jgi:lysophospholipase L1-like esterase
MSSVHREKNTSALKDRVTSVLVLVFGAVLAACLGEAVLRFKNDDMKNYDIEMWKYSRDLKVISPDPKMAFTHRRNASAILQSVTIRTDEWGLRGGPVPPMPPGGRRILFLGSSITLGWGVPEQETLTARLQQMFAEHNQDVAVLNGGVGNYNAQRYVERLFVELGQLEPTDIVVQYFLRDAEDLEPTEGNLLLRHSELAVALWIAGSRLFGKIGSQSLTDYYRSLYRPDAPGFLRMKASLELLADYARERGIRLYLAMTPDVHNLGHYDFQFVHDTMRSIAEADGYTYVDLLPAFGTLTPEQVWAMPGDPHPNALGHRLMAERLFPVIEKPRQ